MSLQQLLIPQDKANHFVYGALAALLGVLIGGPMLGIVLSTFVAVVRELTGDTEPNLADALWTLAGGAVVCSAAWPGALGKLLGL